MYTVTFKNKRYVTNVKHYDKVKTAREAAQLGAMSQVCDWTSVIVKNRDNGSIVRFSRRCIQ